MGKVQEIEVRLLHQHPRNIRTSYEGIDELAESVKAQGILQNLTVIPDYADAGRYLVVIGNRRLLAARAAGIETAPCVVADLSDKEAAAMMLAENRQRNDLTVAEEAKGVQMCLDDYGMSVEELAKETGLSRDFIRTRKKIAELPLDEAPRQASVSELLAASELKDETHREEALRLIGKPSFAYKVEAMKRDEQWLVTSKEIARILEAPPITADKVSQYPDYGSYQKRWTISTPEKAQKVVDELDPIQLAGEFRYTVSANGWIDLFLMAGEAEEEEEQEEDGGEPGMPPDERRRLLKKVEETAAAVRLQWVTKEDRETLPMRDCVKWLTRLVLNEESADSDILREVMGIAEGAERDAVDEAVIEAATQRDERDVRRAVEKLVYSAVEDGWLTMNRWSCAYDAKVWDTLIVRFMDDIGYVWSDEERALLDGTHDLLISEEGQDG